MGRDARSAVPWSQGIRGNGAVNGARAAGNPVLGLARRRARRRGTMSVRTDRQPAAKGARWPVATPHTAASEAAAEVLRAGGNAVDAALAAAAMLTVVYPNQCSVGGDLLALVGTAGGDVRVVNSSGRAPRAVDVPSLAADHDVMPVDGALPVT